MEITGVQTPTITQDDNLFEVFCTSLKTDLPEKSVVIITSKVVSVPEGSIFSFSTEEEFQQKIEEESNIVFGKNGDFFLTEKDGIMMPNAGIDKSNSQIGTALLLPKNPQKSADDFRKKLQEKYALKEIGVVICDSRVIPFRKGISGMALAWSGFVGVSDERGKKDLFGRELEVSQMAVADNLSTTAQLFFGQANERVPFAVCYNAPVEFTNVQQNPRDAVISLEEDLFRSIFKN